MSIVTTKLFKKAINYSLAVMIGVSTLTAVMPFISSSSASALSTTTVKQNAMNGWFFYNDENDTIDSTLGSFVFGPDTAPLGNGSAQISVTGTQRRNIATYQFAGTSLADIDALSYYTYNGSAGNGGSASRSGYLQFNVDFDGSDTWQRRLTYVPSNNGAIVQNTWKQWDAINSGNALWTYSGPVWPGTATPGTSTRTWNDILTSYSGVRVRATDAFLGIRVGEPYASGYTENIDNFRIDIDGNDTMFDFEPLTVNACSATTSVYTSDISDWDLSQTRATGHNEIVDNGLHIWTEGATSTDKAAGYRASDFALADAGVPSITYDADFGIEPSIQMVTDFDNNGTIDGILVGESVYGNDWWVPDSAAQFVKDGAPSHSGGSGSANHGTLDQWLNAFPNARVKQIGYSLGSGVYGDGVITNLTVGCTQYTYGPEIAPAIPGDETVTGTTTTTTTVASIITPIITNPASVLGADTNADGSVDVEGTTDDKTASVKEGLNGIILGLAWYWWILILAGATGLTWWIIAAYRRRNTEE